MKKVFVALALIVSAQNLFAADVHFDKKEIKINKVSLKVEIAENPAQHSHGLMFRKTLPDTEGMLFIFPDSDVRSFWMKDTFLPLSIGFFDEKKKLIDIQDMLPARSEMEVSPPIYNSSGSAKYALEVAKGWFARKKVKIGDQLEIP
jgi:uncharacterized membrane protein (UPF0127 family)